jgi:hypothetical protein
MTSTCSDDHDEDDDNDTVITIGDNKNTTFSSSSSSGGALDGSGCRDGGSGGRLPAATTTPGEGGTGKNDGVVGMKSRCRPC